MSTPDNTTLTNAWVNTKAEEFSLLKPSKPKRKLRRRTSKEQLTALDEFFQTNKRPNTAAKEKLALELEMNPRTIQIWFQNRRQALKKKKLEPLIVPRDPQSDDEKKDRKRKRDYTVLKLNYKLPKPAQISWHYEPTTYPETIHGLPNLPRGSPPVTPPASESPEHFLSAPAFSSQTPSEIITLPSLKAFKDHPLPRIEIPRLSPCYPPTVRRSSDPSSPTDSENSLPHEDNQIFQLPPLRTLPFQPFSHHDNLYVTNLPPKTMEARNWIHPRDYRL
ncbi:hypothetical protein K7432_004435 [Basidiobolus ranarum]|uniref:Homeobox domain-containing protein n=1 Tax=Basidiobolus ranarum TaxID=34480 RepID=A0ABR2WY39_9FUNG